MHLYNYYKHHPYNIIINMDKQYIRILLLIYLMIALYAVPFTFFMKFSKDKGISEGSAGFIFAGYELGYALSSIIGSKILILFDRRLLLYTCILIYTVLSIMFGLINLL